MKEKHARRAVLVLDMTVGLTILLTLMVIATQVGVWSVAERTRSEVRQEALEAVANVLELARGQSLDGLDAAWAAKQKPPEALAQKLNKAKLVVRVEPEEGRPSCKRVRAELTWTLIDGKPAAPVLLTAVFAPRTAEVKGGKP